MTRETRYLQTKRGIWYYCRRVPIAFRQFDNRNYSRTSLKTRSIVVARSRRDAHERADENYWAAMLGLCSEPQENPGAFLNLITRRYEMEKLQAVHKPANEANSRDSHFLQSALEEMIKLVQLSKSYSPHHEPPPARISEAFELYCEKIAFRELVNKSENQKRRWYLSRKTSLNNFISVVGDKYLSAISREDALKFYGWWASRLSPKRGAKIFSSNAGNRDLGAMRKFYAEYHIYFGLEDKPNPFRSLSFRAPIVKDKRPPFEDEWVREKFLSSGSLKFLPEESRYILYALIETGCRPSEITNLRRSNIIISTESPFLKIRPGPRRELKSPSSVRDIPLIGIALEVFLRYPDGFPTYRDKSERASQHLLKALRARQLMPSHQHVIYSFRHSFERRMLEAGLDYDLRCRFMGHAIARPDYGGGGGIRFRRDQLLKIAHPYSEDLFE